MYEQSLRVEFITEDNSTLNLFHIVKTKPKLTIQNAKMKGQVPLTWKCSLNNLLTVVKY